RRRTARASTRPGPGRRGRTVRCSPTRRSPRARPSTRTLSFRGVMRRLVVISSCALLALCLAGAASANKYVGTLAKGGAATIAGTFIKCVHDPTAGIACYVERGGKAVQGSWAATISDRFVEVGKVGAPKATYHSPSQPKAAGAPETTGVKKLTAKV